MTAVLPETQLPELHFTTALAGFPDVDRYALVEVPDADGLFWLTGLVEGGPQFLVAPPGLFFPDYAPEIDDESAARLELTDAADALLLVLLSVGADLASSTANLLAPIVINQVNRRAAQVVLTGDWSLRAPLRAE